MAKVLQINVVTGEREIVEIDLPPAPEVETNPAREALRAIGLTDEQIDALIEAAK